MILTALFLGLCCIASSTYAWEPVPLMNFGSAKVGSLPAGWTAAKTGEGEGSVWTIVEDKDAPGGKALMQTSDKGSGSFFNLCMADGSVFANLDLSVRFKAVAGTEDQGGGLVWRYLDAKNYYVARFNPLENNFRVYRVTDGKRGPPLKDAQVTLPAGQWHTLRVVHKGQIIECYLNGKLYLEASDKTFVHEGQVGVWTKADAQTRFADLNVEKK